MDTNVLPATVVFQIGNVEITNLIVQDQVSKIQNQISDLQNRIKILRDELTDKDNDIEGALVTDAKKQWSDKIKRLVIMLKDFGVVKFRNIDDYIIEMDCHNVMWCLTRNAELWRAEDFKIKKVTVGFNFKSSIKENDDDEHSDEIDIPDVCTVLVTVSDIIKTKIKEARLLSNEVHSLIKQRDGLEKLLEDTDNIEKKVLAALTKQTIFINPGLMTQISKVVSTVEGGPLLISSSK
jgi:hypothetical protein